MRRGQDAEIMEALTCPRRFVRQLHQEVTNVPDLIHHNSPCAAKAVENEILASEGHVMQPLMGGMWKTLQTATHAWDVC